MRSAREQTSTPWPRFNETKRPREFSSSFLSSSGSIDSGESRTSGRWKRKKKKVKVRPSADDVALPPGDLHTQVHT